jgi:hypothetical protein
MEDTSVQFNLGTIDSHGGKLIFQLVVERDGSAYLNVLAFDPTEPTNLGIMSALGGSAYQRQAYMISNERLAHGFAEAFFNFQRALPATTA